MTTVNPYAAPEADELAESSPSYQPKVFSIEGRIGRLRYLAYSMAWTLLVYLLSAAVFALTSLAGSAGFATVFGGLAITALSLVPAFALARRRLHDLNQSGWLSLIILVPIANVVFFLFLIFAPGTQGVNKYGPAPCENSGGVILGAMILPLFMLLGMIAAISIPAYQDYVERAQGAQLQQLD